MLFQSPALMILFVLFPSFRDHLALAYKLRTWITHSKITARRVLGIIVFCTLLFLFIGVAHWTVFTSQHIVSETPYDQLGVTTAWFDDDDDNDDDPLPHTTAALRLLGERLRAVVHGVQVAVGAAREQRDCGGSGMPSELRF
ncbi:hypothetical protein VTH82DRAFT_461 [Thermothelomyces myriococcoides]